jgi:hypothetical protein
MLTMQQNHLEMAASAEVERSAPDTPLTLLRTVSFGDVHIMEFPLELGDNPSVTRGCPLRLGWELLKRTDYDVESYERLRPSRRSTKQLRIPMEKRTEILLNQGHSLQEIASTALAALKIKDSRILNIQNRRRNFDLLYRGLVNAGHRMASQTKFATV